jgi:hypothetical protein
VIPIHRANFPACPQSFELRCEEYLVRRDSLESEPKLRRALTIFHLGNF